MTGAENDRRRTRRQVDAGFELLPDLRVGNVALENLLSIAAVYTALFLGHQNSARGIDVDQRQG